MTYEAHVTAKVANATIAAAHGFTISTISGDGDSSSVIYTSRDANFDKLKDRTLSLMSCVEWTRYKVELIVVDSNVHDEWRAR